MFKFLVVFLISLSLYEFVSSKMTPEYVCENASGGNKTLRLAVHSERSQDNQWFDKFIACTKYSNSSVTMDIDVKHTVFECDGQRIVFIEGAANASKFPTAKDDVIEETSTFPTAKDPLRFRPGKDAEILDDGRVAQGLDNGNSLFIVFTNRPLRDNEIFEVRLDEMIREKKSIRMGVITDSPDSLITSNITQKLDGRRVGLVDDMVHVDGKRIKYGRDLRELQEGDRVGFMRTGNGTVHIFFNGEDQGPAVYDFPSPVYGFVDGFRIKVSIVD